MTNMYKGKCGCSIIWTKKCCTSYHGFICHIGL